MYVRGSSAIKIYPPGELVSTSIKIISGICISGKVIYAAYGKVQQNGSGLYSLSSNIVLWFNLCQFY